MRNKNGKEHAMRYRVECETLSGEMIASDASSKASAERKARELSRKHITAYAVAVENGVAVGHVAYGDGRKSHTEGRTQ